MRIVLVVIASYWLCYALGSVVIALARRAISRRSTEAAAVAETRRHVLDALSGARRGVSCRFLRSGAGYMEREIVMADGTVYRCQEYDVWRRYPDAEEAPGEFALALDEEFGRVAKNMQTEAIRARWKAESEQ